ncbi:MAG: acetate--CoA ligase family protein [Burkholderiaceae bacterium]|nr:acetate--CoA ligase family protein [Burkholderiales bacterium]MCZ8338924.1 acetate--CoA ligase family protein [Burkholderiaceae bacterium]
MKHDPRVTLRVALDPRSIAVIGASENENKIGGRPIAFLKRFGFRGPVYPVNPTREEIQGLRSYASLADCPGVPELAIVAVPGARAVEAVDECARAGVRVCVVFSSGFGETPDPAARAQERAMVECARAAGMRMFGPNSQGLANFGNGAVPSFSTMFVEAPPADGPVGIISQSGAMSVIPYGLLRARGIGVRHAHATGNDADATVCELATVVAQDPALKLLLLYLEGIPDPWHLAEAAKIARERELPIVALKSGRSPAGQAAARSHTGALASEDRVVDAFLADQGIWRVRTTVEMVDAAALYLKGWRPKGRRLVSISNSGAVCVLSADAATDAGLSLEPLADATQAELRTILPGFATTTNPVDITAALLSNSSLFGAILPAIGRDPSADAFFVGIAVAGAGYDVEAFARDAARFGEATGKPLIAAAPQKSVAERFEAHGVVTFPTEGEAVRALGQYLSHVERLRTARAEDAPAPVRRAPAAATRMLDEAASLALLAARGVPTVAHRVCAGSAEARAAYAALGGGRVVVKGVSSKVAHKSELGLVRIGLDSADAVEAAARDLTEAAARAGVALDGVMVARMARGLRELMVGAHLDPTFGAVLVVGDGGKYVEAMPDVATVLAPFTPARIERALRGLRIAPLLDGVRGDPPMDVAAFCRAAAAVGALVADRGAGVAGVDANPVIVGARGEGCTAVDAVVWRDVAL